MKSLILTIALIFTSATVFSQSLDQFVDDQGEVNLSIVSQNITVDDMWEMAWDLEDYLLNGYDINVDQFVNVTGSESIEKFIDLLEEVPQNTITIKYHLEKIGDQDRYLIFYVEKNKVGFFSWIE